MQAIEIILIVFCVLFVVLFGINVVLSVKGIKDYQEIKDEVWKIKKEHLKMYQKMMEEDDLKISINNKKIKLVDKSKEQK